MIVGGVDDDDDDGGGDEAVVDDADVAHTHTVCIINVVFVVCVAHDLCRS